MHRKLLLLLLTLFWAKTEAYGLCVLARDDFSVSMDTYFRTDAVSLKNVFSLDRKNKDDSTTYLGIDYNLGFKAEFKDNGPQFYLKLERNGPYDYDAPLFIHNTLMTSGGMIARYKNEELLPALEEMWVDLPLPGNLRFKPGLFTYAVGNEFSLNGAYENIGFLLSQELNDFSWRFYYCRPDLVYKNRLGPHIHQEAEQGIEYHHNASNFFALDAQLKKGENTFQPYVGALVDYTSEEKRDNLYATPTKEDILGTYGLAWWGKFDNLGLEFEAAHNFGKAYSSDPAYKDVYHTGYLVYGEVNYHIGKFVPSMEFLLGSGNRTTPGMALNPDEKITSGRNNAFSYYSPLNLNQVNSISGNHSQIRPLVAMGSGDGLNYGVPRTQTFFASDFDNIIIGCLGFDYQATEKLKLGLYGYHLNSMERGYGTFEGQAKALSKDLGNEADVFADYQLNKHTLISLMAGYFIPGQFYRAKRDDLSGNIETPFVRGDGKADCAYQIELSMELTF